MNCVLLLIILKSNSKYISVLTEAWLGLENIVINNFSINGCTVYSTTNSKDINDGVVVYLIDTLNTTFENYSVINSTFKR